MVQVVIVVPQIIIIQVAQGIVNCAVIWSRTAQLAQPLQPVPYAKILFIWIRQVVAMHVLEIVPAVMMVQAAQTVIVHISIQALKTNAYCVKTSFQAVRPALLHYLYLVKHAKLLILWILQAGALNVLEIVLVVWTTPAVKTVLVNISIQALKKNAYCVKTSFQAVRPALLHYLYLVKHAKLLILWILQAGALNVLEIVLVVWTTPAVQTVILDIFTQLLKTNVKCAILQIA